MENKEEELNIYSEEVRDVLSHPPKTIFKWGNTILSGFLIILIALSWFIKYPDIITASITITTQLPPEKIIAKSTGRIERILIQDRTNVVENTPLAIIENSANYEDVFLLKYIVDTLKINRDKFSFPIEKLAFLNFGAIESAYSVFEKDYMAYKLNNELKPYEIELTAHSIEYSRQNERLTLLNEQSEIAQKELHFKKQELERNKKLYDKGVISTQEWEQKNVEYLQQEKNINSLNSQISQLRSASNDLNRNTKTSSINQSKEDVNLFRNTTLSLNQLKKAIVEWELAYVIRSSIAGQVSFMQIWSENQTINAGESTFVIIPQEKSEFIGKIKAPALNSGKIKINQDVNIRLLNYPDREFGIIKGKVKSISLTPDKENNLLIDIILPEGLQTTYHKKIAFHQEMSGTADIITEDLRLIERLLYNFRDVFKR